jgi:hypothetical protein
MRFSIFLLNGHYRLAYHIDSVKLREVGHYALQEGKYAAVGAAKNQANVYASQLRLHAAVEVEGPAWFESHKSEFIPVSLRHL